MTAPLTLVSHLSSSEIEYRYRHSSTGVERTHWQMIWLLDQGHHAPAIATQLGYTEDWVRRIIHRYNEHGAEGLRDRRLSNPGAPPLVSQSIRDELRDRLVAPPDDGGIWSGPKVAAWLTERLGRPVAPQRAWEVLRAIGYRLQQPRPAAVRADPVAQEAFKKGGLPPG